MNSFSAEGYINNLNMNSIRLGLESTFRLLTLAGNPDKKLKFIHLAGTNGKGSVGSMLECSFRHAGYKTGFYTSPHLISICERFRVNGKAVDEELLNEVTYQLAELSKGESFSYFEFTTVLAMLIFVKLNVQVVIWETGLGGRLDSTNVVTPECSIITNIALDHQSHLGNTLSLIAREKAGIIKPGKAVFYGKVDPTALKEITSKAQELGCEVFGPEFDVPQEAKVVELNNSIGQEFIYDNTKITLGLAGYMQRENFRIVHRVLKYFSKSWGFDLQQALASLSTCHWPARLQLVNNNIIIDGGHNPDGACALVTSLLELYGANEKFTVIYGAFQDKDSSGCLEQLAKVAQCFVFTSINPMGRPSRSFEELTSLLPNNNIATFSSNNLKEAINIASEKNNKILIAGSLYLAGEALEMLNLKQSCLDLTI
jgi:dihydrofolate synthase/folylpolyglutamate synthase